MNGELILIIILVLFIFGPKNLPKIARIIGRIVGEYRKFVKKIEKELNE